MRAVNLLPHDARSRSGLPAGNAALAAAGGVALVVVIAVAAGYTTAHSRASAEQKKLDAARAQLSQVIALRPAAAAAVHSPAVVASPAVTQQLQPRLLAVGKALEGRIAWDRILREFSLVVPSDVSVSGLTLAPGSGFALTGLAYSQDSVARLLSRLSLIPDLNGVSLKNSSADPASGQVTFTIHASVRTPTVAAVTGA